MAIIGYKEKRDNGTFVRINIHEAEFSKKGGMTGVLRWCKERECGKVVSWNSVYFKTEEELIMFTLAWT